MRVPSAREMPTSCDPWPALVVMHSEMVDRAQLNLWVEGTALAAARPSQGRTDAPMLPTAEAHRGLVVSA